MLNGRVFSKFSLGDNSVTVYMRGVALHKTNAYNDPILDQPEFVEVRSRLGFRD